MDFSQSIPKVSVIIPVYNAERYCSDTISSVLNQTYKNFEIIIVDDGSTDNSLKIIEDFANHESRIKVIHTENYGVSHARNVGLSYASGEWIHFIDSDDYIEPNMMQEMYNIISKHNDVDVVISGVNKIFESESKREIQKFNNMSLNNRKEIGDYLLSINFMHRDMLLNYLWNRWIKRSIISSNNIFFDESLSLGEDFVFNCEVIKRSLCIMLLEDAYYHYYIRGSQSLIHKFRSDELDRRIKMYHTTISLYKYFGIFEDAQNIIEINEGRYSWSSISKINSIDCKFSKKEKIEYIDSFLSSELKKCLFAYLKQNKSVKSFVKYIALKINSSALLFWVIKSR